MQERGPSPFLQRPLDQEIDLDALVAEAEAAAS
jgi:hypothetical protein